MLDHLSLLTNLRSLCAVGAAQEVRFKGDQSHAQQPRGRDLPPCSQQQPLHAGGPALHQRGLRGPGHRLQDHSEFSSFYLMRTKNRRQIIFRRQTVLDLFFSQDFGEFMRENRLTPVSENSHNPSGKLPFERAKSQLERYTRYWPMIISQTTIFNMQAVRSIKTFPL